MKTLMAIAMILGSGTIAEARASRHHLHMTPAAETFMGPIANLPSNRGLGTCNGGACTLTGGPSGGPNQS